MEKGPTTSRGRRSAKSLVASSRSSSLRRVQRFQADISKQLERLQKLTGIRFKAVDREEDKMLLMASPDSPGYTDAAIAVLKKSKAFDSEYYLAENDDVRQSGIDPIRHYILHGGKEGRQPSQSFDAGHYLSKYADVRESGINPLLHYVLIGAAKGYEPCKPEPKASDPEYVAYTERQAALKKMLHLHDLEDDPSFDSLVQPVIDKLLSSHDELLVYPLSYPLEVVQRPDHFFRFMAGRGMACLLLEEDASKEPYIKRLRDGVYVTNLFASSVAYLQDKPTVFYVTYPFYAAVIPYLQPRKVVYDVIDDLTCFSGSLKGLRKDHAALLSLADVVTYSSEALQAKDKARKPKGVSLLVENGVWAQDFQVKKVPASYNFKRTGEKVIGYYGVIGNLLDWDLLAKIAALPKVRLVFIGPQSDFVNASSDGSRQQRAVLKRPNVTYVPTVAYNELPKYAKAFDAAIVPFEVNDITDAVSPLKLYEYMAAGLTVFATPTKTLRAYADDITVADGDKLVGRISEWVSAAKTKQPDYQKLIRMADWGAKFERVAEAVDQADTTRKTVVPKRVDIVNVNFYDRTGKILYKGGAERYVFDLARILQQMGHKPRILQNATTPFTKTYRGVEVVGVVSGATDSDKVSLQRMSKAFNEVCSEETDLIIASPIDLACGITSLPVLGINHGIHWDTKLNHLANNRSSDYDAVFEALGNIRTGVCVDTNFINWTRTYDYSLGEKLRYIPNYYDANEFRGSEKDFEGRLKIMYPRRLYDARGINITLEAFDHLLHVHDDIDLLLVGQTDDKQVKRDVEAIMKKYPGRVTLEEFDMEDMHKAYAISSVVLIPTRYAEGTSLSCLEAMATNNALIATNVGGLPNLVVDGYNGMLIEPQAMALIEAVDRLVSDRKFTRSLAQKGMDMAKVFEKSDWDNRWVKILEEEL